MVIESLCVYYCLSLHDNFIITWWDHLSVIVNRDHLEIIILVAVSFAPWTEIKQTIASVPDLGVAFVVASPWPLVYLFLAYVPHATTPPDNSTRSQYTIFNGLYLPTIDVRPYAMLYAWKCWQRDANLSSAVWIFSQRVANIVCVVWIYGAHATNLISIHHMHYAIYGCWRTPRGAHI